MHLENSWLPGPPETGCFFITISRAGPLRIERRAVNATTTSTTKSYYILEVRVALCTTMRKPCFAYCFQQCLQEEDGFFYDKLQLGHIICVSPVAAGLSMWTLTSSIRSLEGGQPLRMTSLSFLCLQCFGNDGNMMEVRGILMREHGGGMYIDPLGPRHHYTRLMPADIRLLRRF